MELAVTTRCVLGVIGDVSVVIIIGISSVLIRQVATPFHRGFFRDDESLMHPFIDKSTIPVGLLYGLGFSLPMLVIMITEGVLLRLRQNQGGSYGENKGLFWRIWLWIVYRLGLMFFFGVVVTHFSTNVPKYTIGRLRPHFFAVCVPDFSKVTNTQSYITEDICTGNNTDDIKEARVSFPSGHSSMAAYCMLFLVLYLERRFTWQGMLLLKSFLQVVSTLMAVYTCLSRVSDYKHHWSDVLAGGLLGALVAGFVFWSMEKNVLQQLAESETTRGSLVKPLVKTTPQRDSQPPGASHPSQPDTTVL
ncbi:phospholipid phosphatase 1-like [Babylonia areolata]|uniref:phospholipid phosphatase 1-like n=1 Tax=Babylonia areolata TaxID=304850 RepID=UPI003FD18EDA